MKKEVNRKSKKFIETVKNLKNFHEYWSLSALVELADLKLPNKLPYDELNIEAAKQALKDLGITYNEEKYNIPSNLKHLLKFSKINKDL